MNLASPKIVKEILLKYGLSPLKKFGQNFLCDENVVNKIAQTVQIGANVLEIGPGIGTLSKALSMRAKKVVCVEIDKGMVEVLKETLSTCPNITVINEDILKTDLAKLQKEHFNGEDFCVCANLPYYITSKIIFKLLEGDVCVTSICAMVQSEVAQRLTSNPGDANYGAITVSCRYYTVPKLLFYVSKNCFYPMPEVKSGVVYMDISKNIFDVERKIYTKVIKTAFSMRRKTIYNNLLQIMAKEEVSKLLEVCNIEQRTRAEALSEKDFYNLAKNLK